MDDRVLPPATGGVGGAGVIGIVLIEMGDTLEV
jgi:hypothetical protein